MSHPNAIEQQDIASALEEFVSQYDLLNLTFFFKGEKHKMAEAVRNRTPIGLAFLEKIYYKTILDLVKEEEN